MSNNDLNVRVIHNEGERQFEVDLENSKAYLNYSIKDNKIYLTHTEVPKGFTGRGIAGKIVETALEYAKETGMKVIPICNFVSQYIEKNPEYKKLL